MSKRKYEAGRLIESVGDFEKCESLWFMWHGKTIHRAFLESLQYHCLKVSIDNGDIKEAHKKEGVDENNKSRNIQQQ